jgi:hypothetical protein
MNKKITINPIEDHSERFNVTPERLAEANKAILNASKLKKEEEGIAVEIQGDKIVHKRSEQDYKDIWNSFLINEAESFKETMSYGVEDIERIGFKKFIDTNDWRKAEDTCKWKTDKANVIICRHCNNEFACLDITGRLQLYGICNECSKLYDLERIDTVSTFESQKEYYTDLIDPAMKFMAARVRVIEQFISDEKFRENFIKKIPKVSITVKE